MDTAEEQVIYQNEEFKKKKKKFSGQKKKTNKTKQIPMLLMYFRGIKLASGFMKNDPSWANVSLFRISSRIPPDEALNTQKSKDQGQLFQSSLKTHRGLLEKVGFHYLVPISLPVHPDL